MNILISSVVWTQTSNHEPISFSFMLFISASLWNSSIIQSIRFIRDLTRLVSEVGVSSWKQHRKNTHENLSRINGDKNRKWGIVHAIQKSCTLYPCFCNCIDVELKILLNCENIKISREGHCTLVAFRMSCRQAGVTRSKRPATRSLFAALTVAGMLLSQESIRGRQPSIWGSM